MIGRFTRILPPVKGMLFIFVPLFILLLIRICFAESGAGHVYYSVQVAAFKHRESADLKVSELRREGKDAFWRIVEINGQQWHRILVGRFSNMNDADFYRRQLEKAASMTYFVRKIMDDSQRSQLSPLPTQPQKGKDKTTPTPAPVTLEKAPPKSVAPPMGNRLHARTATTSSSVHTKQKAPDLKTDIKTPKTPQNAREKVTPPEPSLSGPTAVIAPSIEKMPPKVQTATDASDGQRFVDNGNGTISDRRMNLMWIKNGWRLDFFSAVDWYKAVEKCSQFKFGGYSDWRLPTLAEWKSIIDPLHEYPALVEPNPFVNIIAHMPYWSQTEYTYKGRFSITGEKVLQAYTVMLYYGSVNHLRKSGKAFVLPVRSVK